jgi:hypothetical protein
MQKISGRSFLHSLLSIEHNYSYYLGAYAFFLLRMFLTFNLYISNSQVKTLILLAHLESQIQINDLGGCTFL